MPIIESNDYRPGWPFRNGHLNTIYPALFRKDKKLPWKRRRITTPDDDFLDLDLMLSGHDRLALLCHGLEGSSDSQYIQGTADLLTLNGWDVAAMNYRGCSGVMNRQARMYHSGATDDLQTALDFLKGVNPENSQPNSYSQIALVGFSLGGNLVLKYAGEQGENISGKIKTVVSVSTPIDLSACSQKVKQTSNYIYEKRFLLRLSEKVRLKNQQHPDTYPMERLSKVKTLWDFDEYFTSVVHGFDGAEDYYAKCNSKQFLMDIQVRTLLLTALDDPLLAPSCFPFEEARESDFFHLQATRYGGHCGHTSFRKRNFWGELRILEFLEG